MTESSQEYMPDQNQNQCASDFIPSNLDNMQQVTEAFADTC